jgi:hypothetical protein
MSDGCFRKTFKCQRDWEPLSVRGGLAYLFEWVATSVPSLSRSGDPATLNFGDAMLIRKFGDVPDNLSAL